MTGETLLAISWLGFGISLRPQFYLEEKQSAIQPTL